MRIGNLPELFQSQVGVPDFKWKQQFGDIVRIKGPFGEDRLFISDPKGIVLGQRRWTNSYLLVLYTPSHAIHFSYSRFVYRQVIHTKYAIGSLMLI